ncbi:putative uncharacterized protein DDB_G0285869 isoform X2 [Macrosteles quadrilineatus]|nr:putative uncharacterized protein DDB_G0285869 isoform X2 [Macrosteles quadrilineatus]
MEDAGVKCLAADHSSIGLPWIFAAIIAAIFWLKVVKGQANVFGHTSFFTFNSDLKYDLLIVKLENLHHKLDKLQQTHQVLEELKMKTIELQSDINCMKSQLTTLKFSSAGANTASFTGGPPPPPPPPPSFSLVTPAPFIKAKPTSVKTAKDPKGPPQFSISQDDIAKMLQKLKKTSSTSRLLGSGNNVPRKTPPRRKLFGKTPGHSRNRRSFTSLSPGDDRTRHKTPLSSISSSPAHTDVDVNENAENGCDQQK